MRKAIYIIGITTLLAACSHIADDEQLIYVAPETAKRTVLLEDFTGQRCVNCPLGTEVIEQLQEAYGDNIIAVGIHGGPLGFAGNNTAIGLATEVGDLYYNYWKLEYQPVGLIDRHGAVNYTDWIAQVKEELARQSSIDIKLEAHYLSNGDISINVDTKAISTAYNGHLQVWVLEDGITAMQKMPDGSTNPNYIHNHVFRKAVNGTWGEAISLNAGEQKTQQLTQAVSNNWNKQQLSIVAFVYNDNGVEQAAKTAITQ